jgi:hypothetical protein
VRTPKWKGSQRNRRTLYNWLINDLEWTRACNLDLLFFFLAKSHLILSWKRLLGLNSLKQLARIDLWFIASWWRKILFSFHMHLKEQALVTLQ